MDIVKNGNRRILAFENADASLNQINLTFSGSYSNLEKPFWDEYFNHNLKHLRNCHFYAIFFYTMAGLVDYALFPENLAVLFSVRFLIVVPAFVIGYISTYTPHYQRYWQQISFFYILITGGSFIAFTVIAPPPKAYDYYAGIFFCMMFGYTLIRERFIYASAAGIILIAGYLFTSAVIIEMPVYKLLQSILYLFFANLLGMLIARHLEVSARKDFYLEYKLAGEKAKVLELNSQLEQRVKERTHDLESANEQLRYKIEALGESEAKRNRLERQLRQAYKMEAIGTLAGGIAHDFNNILSSVIGYTELAIDDAEKGSPQAEYLQEVYIAGNRARDLVRQILAFARQSEEELRPIQVGSIAREVVKLLRSSIPSDIEIRSSIQSDALIVGDPINVHQVLMNLATNAGHSMQTSK